MKYVEDKAVLVFLLVLTVVLCTAVGYVGPTQTTVPPRLTETRARVYVVDTGIDFSQPELREFKCLLGHISIVNTPATLDMHGHGTRMAKLIVKGLNSERICLTSIKWYEPGNFNLGRALYVLANTIKVNSYVSISAGGEGHIVLEKQALMEIIEKHGMVMVAAGNSSQNLDRVCNYFPACYYKELPRNFFVAGATNKYSNSGKFLQVFIANSTSEATARLTNKILTLMEN